MTAPPDVGRGAAVYEPVSSDRPDHDKYEQTKHDCERQSDLVGQFYRVQHAHQPPNHLIMQRLVQPQNRNKKRMPHQLMANIRLEHSYEVSCRVGAPKLPFLP